MRFEWNKKYCQQSKFPSLLHSKLSNLNYNIKENDIVSDIKFVLIKNQLVEPMILQRAREERGGIAPLAAITVRSNEHLQAVHVCIYIYWCLYLYSAIYNCTLQWTLASPAHTLNSHQINGKQEKKKPALRQYKTSLGRGQTRISEDVGLALF